MNRASERHQLQKSKILSLKEYFTEFRGLDLAEQRHDVDRLSLQSAMAFD